MPNTRVCHDSAVQSNLNGQQSLQLGITKMMMQNVLPKTLGHILRKIQILRERFSRYQEGEFTNLMLNAFDNDESFFSE